MSVWTRIMGVNTAVRTQLVITLVAVMSVLS